MKRIAAAAAPADERETRERLMESAARLFAASGFQRVTVREICRDAGANVAAVNYHFGDKLGLNAAVVRAAIGSTHAGGHEAMRSDPNASPEEKLRRFVRVFLERLVGTDPASRTYQLMAREMTDPTPVLDIIVAESIKPRMDYLAEIVAELVGGRRDDPRVMRIVGSIQGQCLVQKPNAVAIRLGARTQFSAADLDALADHITTFSLAGIRAVAPPRR